MEFTKGEWEEWLKRELVDLIKDIEHIEKSDMEPLGKGLERVCALDTKVAKILNKTAAPDLYEALSKVSKIIAGRVHIPIALERLSVDIDRILAKVK